MKAERLIQLLNVGANLAVLGGPVFLGFQVRDGRATARAQIADGIAEGFLEVNALASPTRRSRASGPSAVFQTGLVTDEYWAGTASTAAWKMNTRGGQIFFAENPLPKGFSRVRRSNLQRLTHNTIYDGHPKARSRACSS